MNLKILKGSECECDLAKSVIEFMRRTFAEGDLFASIV